MQRISGYFNKKILRHVITNFNMADAMLSSFERTFIVGGVEQDFRSDGRSCQDYRHFEVETGIVSNTSGSARLRLVCNLFVDYSNLGLDGRDVCFSW